MKIKPNITVIALFLCVFTGIIQGNPQILSPEEVTRSRSLIETLEIAQGQGPGLTTAESQKGFKEQLDKAFSTLTNQVRIVHTLMLQTVDACHLHLQYWYQQHAHPLYYFIRKGPTKWFRGEAQEIEIQSHIDALKQAIELYGSHLGHMCTTTPRLQHSNDLGELITTMYMVAADINALLKMKMPSDKSAPVSISLQTISDLVKENQELLLQAPQLEKKLLSRHKKPDHLTRNWLLYSGLTVAGLYALYYYHNHTNAVDTFARDTKSSTATFIETHVKKPLREIWDTFYGKQSEIKAPDNTQKLPVERSISNEALDAYKDIQQDSLLEWLRDKHPEIDPNQARTIVDDAMKNNMLPIIIQKDKRELLGRKMGTDPVIVRVPYLGIPIANVDGKKYNPHFRMIDMLLGDYNLFLKKFIKKYDDVCTPLLPLIEKNAKDADRLMKANKINFQLMLTLPAIVVMGGLTYVGKTAGSWYTNSLYKPLREGLLNIEVLLNRYNRPGLALDTYAAGLIHYWVFKLSNFGYLVKPSLKQNYLRDLAELDNHEYTVTQKMNTVTRMYRTYSFLNIG
ncbi:MAG: hypothetical protein WCE21_01965 [Candidatus Babeliales bacterium]